MKRRLMLIASVLLAMLAVVPAPADAAWEQLDQSHTLITINIGFSGGALAQTFTAGTSGTLSSIRLDLLPGTTGSITIEIRETNAGVPAGTGSVSTEPNPALATATFTDVSAPTRVTDVTFANPPQVVSGTVYAIVAISTDIWNWAGSHGEDSYAGGTSWLCSATTACEAVLGPSYDQYFQTYVRTPDSTPPTGAVSINDGATHTNTSSATLSLTCDDDVSGCYEMAFSTDGTTFSSLEPFSTSKEFTLPAGEGTKSVYARFIDESGKESAIVSDTIIVDTTAPVIQTLDNQILDPTSPDGAPVTFTPQVTDNLSSAGTITASCVDQLNNPFVSGQVAPIGTTTITCTATDLASNTASESFTVTVLGAADLFDELSAMIVALDLTSSTERTLLAQADMAEMLADWQPSMGCMQLTVFDMSVRAQESRRRISRQDAAEIYAQTQRLRNVIGCGGLNT